MSIICRHKIENSTYRKKNVKNDFKFSQNSLLSPKEPLVSKSNVSIKLLGDAQGERVFDGDCVGVGGWYCLTKYDNPYNFKIKYMGI